MFEINDFVIHAREGLSTIISTSTINGRDYFLVKSNQANGETIYVPVDTAANIIRPVLSDKEADEVLKYILNKNCFDDKNMKYWSRDDINAAASDLHLADFWNSILVDDNNCEASESEINDWKEGRRRLWACQLHVRIGKVDIKELIFD